MTTYLDKIAELDKIVCVDIETGGLEADRPITEIAYAGVTQIANPITIIPPHDPSGVGEWSLANTGYLERGLNKPENWCSQDDIDAFVEAVCGKYILGSNPRFDVLRLSNLLGGLTNNLGDLVEPWQFRLINAADIGTYALGYTEPQGIWAVSNHLREMGYDISEPNHSAARDVQTTWEVYLALLDLRESR